MTEALTGKGVDRVDARLKVTGRADYAAETPVANVGHAAVVTSTIGRGRIVAVDLPDEGRADGLLAVLTHETAPRLPGGAGKVAPFDKVLHVLQDDHVYYQDQPVAVVVCDTLERAQHAASLVKVRYAPERGVFDIGTGAENAYVPQSAGPHGPAESHRGDADAAFAAAKVRLEQTYTTPAQNHNPMEMHATIAVWPADDRLTVYDATQGIFAVRKKLAVAFGLPPANVRVISHYVGGGFGCKGSPWSHVLLAAMAARAARRPVKLVVPRAQMFSNVGHRSPTIQRVALATDHGPLTAIRHQVTSWTSRFDEFVEPAAVPTRMLYACPNVTTGHRLVRLDVPTPTFMRAPGQATGTYAIEAAMDELAYALRIDPLRLRLESYAETDPDEGKPWSSKSLRACYQRGAAAFGWSRRRPEPRATREGRLLVGLGTATATYPAHLSPASASAHVRADGAVLVQAGSQDIGTGTYTIMTQIAADALGVPFERVRFELGDTELPETPVSGGSQTAASTGSAVKRACLALREQLATMASADPRSPLHGVPTSAIDAQGGALFAKGSPSRRDDLGAIVGRSGRPELTATVQATEKEDRKRFSTHAFGAQFAEVTVDEDLGEVRVRRFTGAFAAGKILNPKTARSQFQGGIVWGIGFALTEQTRHDPRSGRITTRDLSDYHVPVHADVPDIEVLMIDEEDPHVNDLGAKGIGEIGITGSAAAVANAVFHATGRRVRDLPITPDKLL